MDTKAFIAKLDEVSKRVDLDVSTIMAEQIKDTVLGTVSSRTRKKLSPFVKSAEIQQSKGLLRFCQELDRPFIEPERQWLCCNETSEKIGRGTT